MIQLNIEVNQDKAKPAQSPVKFSKRRAYKVSKIELSWYEEQALYDRMYESEVWKNGHFFGYRSQVAAHWHTSDQAITAAKEPLSNSSAVKLNLLLRTLKQGA